MTDASPKIILSVLKMKNCAWELYLGIRSLHAIAQRQTSLWGDGWGIQKQYFFLPEPIQKQINNTYFTYIFIYIYNEYQHQYLKLNVNISITNDPGLKNINYLKGNYSVYHQNYTNIIKKECLSII